MKFGPIPVRESAGLIAAHGVRGNGFAVRKGQTITPEDTAALERAGLAEVVVAILEPGDVGEDAAAERLARCLAGPGLRIEPPFTGRCNLFAAHAGVLLVEAETVDALNGVDESITAATLPPFKPVVAGEMVATVKIIPYAVAGAALGRAATQVPAPPLRIAPYRRRRVAVISTLLSGLKPATIDKTLRVLADRLAPAGAEIVVESRVPHEARAVAEALGQAVGAADLVVVFGASAIADRRDVIPAGIEAAGGQVAHFGMPVDPGNLLLLGALREMPVIGAPGCARSPVENGFDWILHRLLADLPVTRADIVRLGVGGLLMEIVSRPQPREGGASAGEEA
ncbi:molybdopterin-binding protein [Methylobacterium organophilum]|uniref:MoaB/Mog domain-containing protein n=1 Tax=Methylobacterium organophilum TaxID=410 RepID=A0ABQ4T9B5_METOR|nr:molybdopterin-binding protein [Methylobacterium organophilum]GJE28260.1 hypothetical protein LKMONMHP_3127 [Methylobacterium organophilum]